MVHVSVCPETPIVGVVEPQSQVPRVSRRNVVWAGTLSVRVIVPASLGPLLVAVIVYVSSAPGATPDAGLPVLATAMSEDAATTVTGTGPALLLALVSLVGP